MKAVVVGIIHHNTLSMVRCLGMKGIQTDLIICDNKAVGNYVATSKYINRVVTVANATEAVAVLHKDYQYDAWLICSDDVAALVDTNLVTMMDKQHQVELAKIVGLDVPYSQVARIGSEVAVITQFPCIVKPLESIHGGKRIDVCKDKEELYITFKSYEKGDVVQVQQFIQRDYEIVVDGVSLSDGNIIIPGYIHKYRDLMGGTTFSETKDIASLSDNLVDKIKSLIKQMNYTGLFGVEFIVCRDKYYFIEINLRNDATTYALAVAGVNLPYIYYLNNNGDNYEHETRCKIREIKAMVELRDVTFLLKGKISLVQWIKDYNRAECKYYKVKGDLQPFYFASRQYVISLLGKILKWIKR